MRNLLLLLILANALYFLWERFGEKAGEVGIAVLEERRLGPRLELARAGPKNVAAAVTAVLDSEGATDLVAMVGQACISISFRERPEAASALDNYRNAGMRASLRSAEGEVFIGNWVQIRNIPSREAGNEMLRTLQDSGVSEVILLQDTNGGYKISLGLFGEKIGVERMELAARSLGMEPEILPEVRNAMLHYVDIALLPGRGAGDMVEQYGEARVLLRDLANCPTAD
jgi:hypothetical protein